MVAHSGNPLYLADGLNGFTSISKDRIYGQIDGVDVFVEVTLLPGSLQPIRPFKVSLVYGKETAVINDPKQPTFEEFAPIKNILLRDRSNVSDLVSAVEKTIAPNIDAIKSALIGNPDPDGIIVDREISRLNNGGKVTLPLPLAGSYQQ